MQVSEKGETKKAQKQSTKVREQRLSNGINSLQVRS